MELINSARTLISGWILAFIAPLVMAHDPVAPESGTEKKAMILVFDTFDPLITVEDDHARGLYVDILQEALEKRLSIPVEFRQEPWRRAQQSVRQGKADGMVTLATPERLEYAVASEVPVAIAQIGAFASVNHPKFEQFQSIKTIDDLRPYRLITYLGDGWAMEKLDSFNVEYAGNDFETVFRRLTLQRGDLFIQAEDVAQRYIAQLGLADQVSQIPDTRLGQLNFRLLLSRKSTFVPRLPEIDAVLQVMRDEGTIAAIRSRRFAPSP